jgi:hypothetical protein
MQEGQERGKPVRGDAHVRGLAKEDWQLIIEHDRIRIEGIETSHTDTGGQ